MSNSANLQPRITAGIYKNRRLLVPKSARPITERIKIKMFDLLSSVITDANCLDVFSGSGNIGIEALSRGAATVDFVDSNSNAIETIKKNIETIFIPSEKYRVISRNYSSHISSHKNSYDIVFADPPFHSFAKIRIAKLLEALHDGGILVLKAPHDFDKMSLLAFKDSLILEESIGRNYLLIFRK